MRLNLATSLKTRTGAPSGKDARLNNSYVEVKGDASAVRKRPCASGGLEIGTGLAQGGGAGFVIYGDELIGLEPSVWTTRAFNPTWIADHVAAGFGTLYQFEWMNTTAKKSTDLGASWSNITMPAAIIYNMSALFVSGDTDKEMIITGDYNENCLFTKDGANFYEITMPFTGGVVTGADPFTGICIGNNGGLCVADNGAASKAATISTLATTGTGTDITSYVPFSASFGGETCFYFLGRYYIADGTNAKISYCSFFPTIWTSPVASGTAAFSTKNLLVINEQRVIIIDNNGDIWIAEAQDRYVYGLRFRKVSSMPNAAPPYQIKNAGLYLFALSLTATAYVSFDLGETWKLIESPPNGGSMTLDANEVPPTGGRIAALNDNCVIYDDGITSVDALEGQRITL